MNTRDAVEFFQKNAPQGFVNEICARIILRADKFRPVKHAKDVRCPVLLQICEQDSLIPKSAAEDTEKELGKYAQVTYYPSGHFDIYTGENFEKAVNEQLEFFKKHL